MPSLTHREKFLLVFLLSFLAVSAFIIRTQNFLNPTLKTIDEWVFYYLGSGLTRRPFEYNTIGLAKILGEAAPHLNPLPEYFTKPLFKYPPLFSGLTALSIGMFGDTPLSAVYVSAAFGSLLIVVGFLLGNLYFGPVIGILAAFMLWLDPINTISSQKIWTDTALSFFIGLAILLFGYGVERKKNSFYLWSGAAAGMAALVKYPGLLASLIIALYAAIYRPNVFKEKKFLFSLLLPALMLLPWGFWNYHVYGGNLTAETMQTHDVKWGMMRINVLVMAGVITVGAIALKILRFSRGRTQTDQREDSADDQSPLPGSWNARRVLVLLYVVIFLFLLRENIGQGLNPWSFPKTSWQAGLFNYPLFYFGQLIEFSFLYVFSFTSFFFYSEKRFEKAAPLVIGSVVIFGMYLAWGSYQCRYVLPAIPFLIILGLKFLEELLSPLLTSSRAGIRRLTMVVLVLLAAFVVVKINYVNFLVSYPNDMCYF